MELGYDEWLTLLLDSAERALPQRNGATASVQLTFLAGDIQPEEVVVHMNFVDGRLVNASRGEANFAPDISLLIPEQVRLRLMVDASYSLPTAIMEGSVVADGSLDKLMLLAGVVTAPEYQPVRSSLVETVTARQ